MSAINIIFDGPPGHESGRFVEVENDQGASISVGKWGESDGLWALRITSLPDEPDWPRLVREYRESMNDYKTFSGKWKSKIRRLHVLENKQAALFAALETND